MRKRATKVGYSSRINKRNKSRRTFKIVLALFVPALLALGIVYLLRLDSLQITNIEVEGTVAINSDELSKDLLEHLAGAYLGVIPRSSIFLVDENELETTLLSKFGRLEEVEVSKSIAGSLKVSVVERSSSGVWCRGEDACYLLDESGLLFTRASASDLPGKIVFRGNISGDPLEQKFGTEAEMSNYFEVINTLKTGGLEIKSLYVESKDKAVLSTSVGDIIFMPEEPNIQTMCENVLLLISTEQAKKSGAIFEYIDARFGNKLFYKVI